MLNGKVPNQKTVVDNLESIQDDVAIVEYLFSPRRDRFGSETPSEASRIFFLIVILSVSYWAWQISNGIVSIWLMIVILISTPILSVGWWLISLISQKRPTKDLFSE